MTVGALEAGLYRAFRFNPCVAWHELRLHMRGWRPFIVLLAYASIASAAVLLTFLPALLEESYGSYGGSLGRTALTVLAFTQLTLIMLLLPAYAAAAIAMEREKRTLDMLRATLVTPTDVVTGKLFVVFAFGVVLLLTSLPVAAWCLLLGGVSPEEVLYTYTYLLAAAALVSALGLWFSARVARPMGAVVSTYGTLILVGVLSTMTPSLAMFIAMSGPGAPRTPTFGSLGALAVTGTAAVLAGLLALRLFHSAAARALGRRRAMLARLLAVLATLALALALRPAWSAATAAVERAYFTWMMIVNPYVALAGILLDEFGSALSGGMGSTTPGAASIQLISWSLGIAINVFLALLLWALAIRSYARRA